MSYPTIEPCPSCGGTFVHPQYGRYDTSKYHVECLGSDGCGMRGPVMRPTEERDAEGLAIERWNQLARDAANWRKVRVSADRVLEVIRG